MLYSSLMRISQTHHSPDPNNVNVDELHERGSCPHPILQDFNRILPFLLRTSPLPSTGLLVVRSGVLSVLTHRGNGLCAVRSAVLPLFPPGSSCPHLHCLCCLSTSCHTPAATRRPSQVQPQLPHGCWL